MGKRGEVMQAEILAILRRSYNALTAYEILKEVREGQPKIAPTTIYRALAVLMGHGRVHRLESLNAYMACRCDAHAQAAILSICNDCGTVEETIAPDLLMRLARVTGQSGFETQRHVIEIHGVCAACGAGEARA